MGESATTRFSSRVEHYVRARPGYPRAFIEFLREDLGIGPERVIADVGSGTGILTAALVAMGNEVAGVEPNAEMRRAAEEMLRDALNFRSVEGTAEKTTLGDASVDVVVAAQAFHWFDPPKARAEFKRILRPPGLVVLVWNDRRTVGPAFSEGYERFIQRFNHEPEVLHCRNITRANEGVLAEFFAPGGYEKRSFPNEQRLDFEGLAARVLSSSYMPLPESPKYEGMMEEMRRLFDAHASGGGVVIEYDTVAYYGRCLGRAG